MECVTGELELNGSRKGREKRREREGVSVVRGLVPEAPRCHNMNGTAGRAAVLANGVRRADRLVLFWQEPCEANLGKPGKEQEDLDRLK